VTKNSFWYGAGVILLISVVTGWLLQFFISNAQAQPTDDLVCPRAIAHGFYYSDKPDTESQQEGIWYIVGNPDFDDSQRYVNFMVYHTIQRISYRLAQDEREESEEYWLATLNQLMAECENLLMVQRFPGEIR